MPPKCSELFINNVRKLLGERSFYWLAKESGISQATLSRLMSGESSPSIETLEALSTVFEVTAASLISDTDPIPLVVEKKVTLEDVQAKAIKTMIADMIEEKRIENPLASAVVEHVPPDILECLLQKKEKDWDFIRAALNMPGSKKKASSVKKRKVSTS